MFMGDFYGNDYADKDFPFSEHNPMPEAPVEVYKTESSDSDSNSLDNASDHESTHGFDFWEARATSMGLDGGEMLLDLSTDDHNDSTGMLAMGARSAPGGISSGEHDAL